MEVEVTIGSRATISKGTVSQVNTHFIYIYTHPPLRNILFLRMRENPYFPQCDLLNSFCQDEITVQYLLETLK